MSNNTPRSNDYKNQHYLPRLYLKNFTSLKVPGKVWVLRRGQQHWSDCGIKNVARSEHLHSILKSSGEWNHEVEQMFSQIEREWKPLLEKVLNQHPLTVPEESVFASGLGVLWHRTPTAVEPINEAISQVLHGVRHLANSISEEKMDLSGIKVRYNPLHSLMTSVQTGVKIGKMIRSMAWKFLHSQPPNFFITSDFPVGLCNSTNPSEAVGLAHPEVEFTIPLSRQVALLAGWNNTAASSESTTPLNPGRYAFSVGADIVAAINVRTIMFARRELIAPERNFPGADEITELWRQAGPRRDDEPEEIRRFSLR